MTRNHSPKRANERIALGHRLMVLRVDAKLKQAEVAVALGVRPATVSAWETGTSEPFALDLRRLARLFKVDVSAILPPLPDDEE